MDESIVARHTMPADKLQTCIVTKANFLPWIERPFTRRLMIDDDLI